MTDLPTTLVSVVIGGLIGSIGTYIGAVRISNKQRMIESGRRLREAFIGDITAIQINQDNVPAHLERRFGKHLMAVNEFRWALPEDKRNAFDKAWKEYCGTENRIENILYDFSKYNGFPSERFEGMKLAVDNIHKLFAFAEEKEELCVTPE